jgi:hypothetical protein
MRRSSVTDAMNPVRLKIALATRGARIDDRLRARLGDVPDFVLRALDVVLPDDVRVLVPIGDGTNPYAFRTEDDRVLVVGDGTASVEVQVGSLPRYYGRRTGSGRPMWQVATIVGAHLLVSPGGACGFSTRGAPCGFCREGARPGGEREHASSIADVVEVVRTAFEEGVAESVFFNSCVYDPEDGGIGHLTPYIEAVRKHFDTFVAVQVHPPRTDVWIDRTYAMGVDALSYNVELFDPEALGRHCIGRMRYIGRERYLDALRYAASVFPAGTVWSDLVLGLEPVEATMAGIEALAGDGIVPVLSIHRPDADGIAFVGPEEAAAVVAHLERTVRARRLNVAWVRDLALGVTPLDACRLTGTSPPGGTLQLLTRWRLGAYAARGIARFRRRLRVRAIGDSLESSHL